MAFLLLATSLLPTLVLGQPSASPPGPWAVLSKTGVAIDEGEGVGDFNGCDVECCKQKCDANPQCNSFAASAGNCFLKDKCIDTDTPWKKSGYRTYYRPCPEHDLIEATCGIWTSQVENTVFNTPGAAIAKFTEWQNCVVKAAQEGQASTCCSLFLLSWFARSLGLLFFSLACRSLVRASMSRSIDHVKVVPRRTTLWPELLENFKVF